MRHTTISPYAFFGFVSGVRVDESDAVRLAETICGRAGVTLADVRRHNRKPPICQIRQAIAYWLHHHLKASDGLIASVLDRERTTIVDTRQRVDDLRTTDPAYMIWLCSLDPYHSPTIGTKAQA